MALAQDAQPILITLHGERVFHNKAVSILTLDDAHEAVFQHATHDLLIVPDRPSITFVSSFEDGKNSIGEFAQMDGMGEVHAILSLEMALLPELLPDQEGLDHPDFKNTLVSLVRDGMDDMLAKNEKETKKMVDELGEQVEQLQKGLQFETERFDNKLAALDKKLGEMDEFLAQYVQK